MSSIHAFPRSWTFQRALNNRRRPLTTKLRRATPKTAETVLRPIHPNIGIELEYRRQLLKMIDAMAKSVEYWLTATYRQNEPRIAQDESPADALRRSMKELSKRWLDKFDEMSVKLAEYFAQSVEKRSTLAMKKILKDGGWTVKFQITPAMRDVIDATVHENVSLIKSIPQQYLSQVEGIVMRGVQNGRDLGVISKELQDRLGVTRRRAALISRDQTNKATASLSRARQIELGIEEAVWVHSGGGREPRPTHLKAGRDKVKYNIREGWYDPHEQRHIQPGELINCKCVGRPVIKGFN
ncbi:phage head morphogenesis protein [Agrobacterium rhizogenes]|nr:phage head morphogenesis protein [Rhizobium rhizogenes]NTJ77381.1 phage head morphogenesis protein [Rhizobium rhizogenes]